MGAGCAHLEGPWPPWRRDLRPNFRQPHRRRLPGGNVHVPAYRRCDAFRPGRGPGGGGCGRPRGRLLGGGGRSDPRRRRQARAPDDRGAQARRPKDHARSLSHLGRPAGPGAPPARWRPRGQDRRRAPTRGRPCRGAGTPCSRRCLTLRLGSRGECVSTAPARRRSGGRSPWPPCSSAASSWRSFTSTSIDSSGERQQGRLVIDRIDGATGCHADRSAPARRGAKRRWEAGGRLRAQRFHRGTGQPGPADDLQLT